MGYLGNHLATVTMAVFAAILTGLWPYFVDFAPILEFVFIMAVPISWFLVVVLWLAQKSTDYMHNSSHETHYEKKSLSKPQPASTPRPSQVYTSDGKLASKSEIKEAQSTLTTELTQLKETVKLKDSEIERLNQEIANLQTLVQIESLKTELANLKMMASEKKRKTK